MATTEAGGAADEAKWLAMARCPDSITRFSTGLISPCDGRRDRRCRGIRVPGFSPPAQERFLPGLEKLGLSHLPPAVAAAQYHYLSNWIGGVSVEYSVTRRPQGLDPYPHAALDLARHRDCGGAREVFARDAARLARNNGLRSAIQTSLVCTKQSVDGQDGLEGYYCEYDHALDNRCALGIRPASLEAPMFDPQTAPALPVASWPKPRLKKPIGITR